MGKTYIVSIVVRQNDSDLQKTCGGVALFSIPAGIHLLGAKIGIDVESNKIHPKPALWLLVVCEMCPR